MDSLERPVPLVAKRTSARARAIHSLVERGVARLRGALDRAQVARLAACADRRYAGLEVAHAESGDRYVASASSFDLRVLDSAFGTPVIEWLVQHPSIVSCVESLLGSNLAVDLDHAWVRRQFAPARSPPGHAPHSWHQDGALRFDFLKGDPSVRDALLPMVTCWCPLGACGHDAPGLEIVAQRLERMRALPELADASVRASFPQRRLIALRMRPGDVLLMTGDLLHRTHVTRAMCRDRTSIEIRFFDALRLPERLRGDRFLRVSGEANES